MDLPSLGEKGGQGRLYRESLWEVGEVDALVSFHLPMAKYWVFQNASEGNSSAAYGDMMLSTNTKPSMSALPQSTYPSMPSGIFSPDLPIHTISIFSSVPTSPFQGALHSPPSQCPILHPNLLGFLFSSFMWWYPWQPITVIFLMCQSYPVACQSDPMGS